MIGVYDYTVFATYAALVLGMSGIFFTMDGNAFAATVCLMAAGFLDAFDGRIARTKKNRTADEKNFGIQLDSLCDVICFGVFPAIYLYCCGLDTPWGITIAVFYALCALIRLAFFNVIETKRQETENGCAKYYRGLPVTTSAIIYPIIFLIGLALPENAMLITYYVIPVLMGFLFIGDFRVPKLDISKLFRK